MGELLYIERIGGILFSNLDHTNTIAAGFIPAPSGNDLGAAEHYSVLAGIVGINNSRDWWDFSITQEPFTTQETCWAGARLYGALTTSSWMVPRSETERRPPRTASKAGRKEKNSTLDKIHQLRLTTNGCMLAATINTTWEDKMRNSKWRNQRTCQRLSESTPHTQWDQSLTGRELDFLER